MQTQKHKTGNLNHVSYLRGFTLMEMLIVISIISVLLGLLYGALERAQKFSRRTMTYTEVKNIQSAFKQYFSHYSVWPDNTDTVIKLNSGNEQGGQDDQGFIIDSKTAEVLQGLRLNKGQGVLTGLDKINTAAIPFIEFARHSSSYPINPFKSQAADDGRSRAYRVLFDTNGDQQIEVPGDDPDAPPNFQSTNIIASVVVWTWIPATRTANATGAKNEITDDILGSWSSFTAR